MWCGISKWALCPAAQLRTGKTWCEQHRIAALGSDFKLHFILNIPGMMEGRKQTQGLQTLSIAELKYLRKCKTQGEAEAMRKRGKVKGLGWILEVGGRTWGSWFAAPAGAKERKWKTKPETLELSGIPGRNLQVFSYLSVIWAQEHLFLLGKKKKKKSLSVV